MQTLSVIEQNLEKNNSVQSLLLVDADAGVFTANRFRKIIGI